MLGNGKGAINIKRIKIMLGKAHFLHAIESPFIILTKHYFVVLFQKSFFCSFVYQIVPTARGEIRYDYPPAPRFSFKIDFLRMTQHPALVLIMPI